MNLQNLPLQVLWMDTSRVYRILPGDSWTKKIVCKAFLQFLNVYIYLQLNRIVLANSFSRYRSLDRVACYHYSHCAFAESKCACRPDTCSALILAGVYCGFP